MTSFRQWFVEEIVPVLRTAQRVPGVELSRTFIVSREVYDKVLERAPTPLTTAIRCKVGGEPKEIYCLRVQMSGDQHGYWLATEEKPVPVLDDIWGE